MLQLLLKAGCDPHGTGVLKGAMFGFNALHAAALRGHTVAIGMLAEAGVSLQARTPAGSSALYLAASNGHADSAEALIDLGADIDAKCEEGQTPLYVAARQGHESMVTVLLRAGVAVDMAKDSGATPLHAAANRGHLGAARSLILAGANKDAPKASGSRPLFTACAHRSGRPLFLKLSSLCLCFVSFRFCLPVLACLSGQGTHAPVRAFARRSRPLSYCDPSVPRDGPRHNRLEMALTLVQSGADTTADSTKCALAVPRDMASAVEQARLSSGNNASWTLQRAL